MMPRPCVLAFTLVQGLGLVTVFVRPSRWESRANCRDRRDPAVRSGSAAPPPPPSRGAEHVLFATMHFPGDKMPAELVLRHQLRALQAPGGPPLDTVVLDNRPPWTRPDGGKPLEPYNRTLPSGVRVKEVDYAHFRDAGFLGRFFNIVGSAPGQDATVADLTKRAKDGFGTTGRQIASNFMGLLTFLELCSEAGEATGLCVYLDPDIFLHRFTWGIADLAPDVFQRHPTYIGLQPPTICDGHEHLVGRNGNSCRASRAIWPSSRHMIWNRSRLLQELPFIIEASRFGHFFETVLNGVVRHKTGHMMCGAETFAIHPPSRHTRRLTTKVPTALMEPVFNNSALATDDGIRVMIERLEAGQFELPSIRRSADSVPTAGGAKGCQEPLAANLCFDMLPSEARIREGMAW